MKEGVPENLGHEWRVLHPFEIPGIRFPTDNTPPNQRRLAENVLVELIQITEYLEDTPMWGQRDYQFYPHRYSKPFYRGRGRGEEEVEVEAEENGWVRDHLKEKQSKDLGEVLPIEMEEKMGEESIPRPFWKELREIGRRRNGQILRVMEEEQETSLYLPHNTRITTNDPTHSCSI